MSDAEEALVRTAASLQSMGSVVIEQRMNGDRRSFTVAYVSERQYYPYNPYPPYPENR
ncbi:MAG: hypothetical protein HY746_06640 [Elusimicrobia bacterium]|nr:hypothetical protein [Elusimicrobiota bacterium]